MKTKLHILSLLSFLPLICFGQATPNEYKTRKIVLEKGIINKTTTFGKFVEYKTDELQLTYLGILTSKETSFKIMKSLWRWGAGRATSRILIYDVSDEYVGEYCLTMTYELPTKIKNNKLQFKIDSKECGDNNESSISFKDGIPDNLILNCGSSDYLASTFSKAN